MDLWTNHRGVTLQSTTDKNYVYLAVTPERRDGIKPYMELLTAYGVKWHTGTQGGWIVPTTILPTINPFLARVHRLWTDAKETSTDDRGPHGRIMGIAPSRPVKQRSSGADGGLETVRFEEAVRDTDGEIVFHNRYTGQPVEPRIRAVTWYISYQEVRLLHLLNDGAKSYDPAPKEPAETERNFFHEERWLGSHDFDEGELPPAFLQLMHTYLIHRGCAIQGGDLLKHEFMDYRNSGVFISNGTTFIELDNELDDYGALPREFKCPTPFPIMWWEGCIVHNMIVWPNFSLPMEFEAHPPPISDIKDYVVDDANRDIPPVALTLTHNKTIYRIYFFNDDGVETPLTYERVLAAIHDPTHRYGYHDEHTIVSVL